MEYRFLGNTGIKVSRFAYGTMSFGGDADENTSADLFHKCREHGINFFDCANMYQKGKAEEILGKLITHCRNDVIISSKVYFNMGDDVNAGGASRRHIMQAAEASLKRLNTDRIDLYFIHRFDDRTDLEQTLRTLDDLVHQGKILYTMASNFAAWQITKALGISSMQGLAKFAGIQPMYNLVKRQAEVELLPMAASENLAVFPYSPLGGGVLTGKYLRNTAQDSSRLNANHIYKTRYGDPLVDDTVERFVNYANEHGYEPASLAVAWVAGNPAVTAPILGARNINQLESSLKALEIPMTKEMYSEISALSPTPAPATDRNEEQSAHSYGVR
ncbi:MAG: aldo/keto reductase [Anaerolineaceae bacterium]|nr:aldo/keto reductase [Anaerolineaceae bacterium]